MSRLPDFVVIGAMKCATSTLADQLNGQDGIFITDPKEPCYFSDDHVFDQGLEAYSKLFDAAAPGDLLGDASTHYTKLPNHPDTIARMQAAGLDAKFVYVMRHPVDRLISHFVHAWTMKEVQVGIEEAVDAGLGLVEFGCYAMQLQPYLEAFGRERVLPVFYNHMTAHPDDELRRICAFLGLQGEPTWDHGQERQNVSAQRMRTSPLRDALLNAPVLSTVRKWFPRDLRDRVKGLWQMKKRPELSEATRQRVEAVFDQDLWLQTFDGPPARILEAAASLSQAGTGDDCA